MSKKKIVASVVSLALTGSLLVGGTLAWQSISQEALNEVTGIVNPGGRLHDDFDGKNKDVYVENFADEPIFARVRLDEFLQIYESSRIDYEEKGTPAPYKVGAPEENPGKDAYKKDNVVGYVTYKPLVDENGNMSLINPADPFREFVDWDFSGSTVYMPTFNMNKDSHEADVNGSIDVTLDGKPYADYTTYYENQPISRAEIHDNDSNDVDEVKNVVSISDSIARNKLKAKENGEDPGVADYLELINREGLLDNNVTHSEQTHKAKATLYGTVLTMQEWIELQMPVGEYWVYDVDGWAYWAAPIEPNTATGLLLNGISITRIDNDYDYDINVVAQFVTAGDVGKTEGTGFYDQNAGGAPSEDAEALLIKIGAMESKLEISSEPINAKEYNIKLDGAVGDDVEYKATGSTMHVNIAPNADRATGATVTMDDDEKSTAIVIIATNTYKDADGNDVSRSVETVIAYTPTNTDGTEDNNN